jgi:hypothetical protein
MIAAVPSFASNAALAIDQVWHYNQQPIGGALLVTAGDATHTSIAQTLSRKMLNR